MSVERPGTRHPVVVIGDALIDEIRDSSEVTEFVGGAALNVAVGLRRLEVPAALIAMLGADEPGDRVRAFLAGQDVALIESAAPHGSARAIVTRADGGEPSYVFNRAARERSIRYSPEAQRAITLAPVVVVSCFPFDVPQEVEALRAALGDARVAIDPNPRSGMMRDREEFVRGFEQVVSGAVVKVGADDAELLYDGDLDALRARLRDLGAAAVLATAGAAGAVLESDAGVVRAGITDLPGDVIDTVGAGDATLAALVAGIAAVRPEAAADWQRLLDRAMAVAAATCRAAGGMLRTPESLVDATEPDV